MVDLDLDFDYSDDQSDLDLSFCLSEPDDQPQSVNVNLCNGSPLNSNDLIVAHWNVNSILKEGRLDELFLNIQSLKAQIVILTESKLDSSIPSNIITFLVFMNLLGGIATDMEEVVLSIFPSNLYLNNNHKFNQSFLRVFLSTLESKKKFIQSIATIVHQTLTIMSSSLGKQRKC